MSMYDISSDRIFVIEKVYRIHILSDIVDPSAFMWDTTSLFLF